MAIGRIAGLALAATLAACSPYAPFTSPSPPARPAAKPAQPAPELTASSYSTSLARYYRNLQADLLARGLMRTDGGGPDTAFRPSDLARNFEQIVFYDEYATTSPSLKKAGGDQAGLLRRWTAPVRIRTVFGDHVRAQKTRPR